MFEYNHKGKLACASKQIPESALVKIAEEIGMSRITGITAENGNRLIFHLSDDMDIEKTWLDRSRAESWTEDKRKEAAEASKARCQKCRREALQ